MEEVRKLVRSDRRLNVRMMARKLRGRCWLNIWEWGKFKQRWCHEFCLMTRNSGGLMFVLTSRVSWSNETTFWIELSRVMNHDTFSTIRKRNAKACDGKHQRHRDQTRHACH
jgi:hypothetical protein